MSPRRRAFATFRTLWLAPSLLAAACGTETLATDTDDTTDDVAPDASGPDAAPPFELDMFGTAGNTYRFDVTPAQAQLMDSGQFGGPIFNDAFGCCGDPYEVGGGGVGEAYTYADDLTITTVGGQSKTFGKMAVWTVGQSTFRPWSGIPNIRVDTGKVEDGLKIDGFEDFRFNNGQVGGIYREAIALRLWDAMGYATPETTFAWVEAPQQWGEDRVPMTQVEVYKHKWCDREIPGGCVNLWESVGEPFYFGGDPSACQVDQCDGTRLNDLQNVVNTTPFGPGYTAALSSFVDWDKFRDFMCLSWISNTGDDYVHNNNNVVVVERDDGRIQLHPYSVDISAAQEWYPNTPLMGTSTFARGCQTDPECWDALLVRCDEMLDQYDTLDVPATIVQPVLDMVESNGMMRAGDDERAAFVLDWYTSRADKLRTDEVWNVTPCLDDTGCAAQEYCDQWSQRCYPN